jgi:addiction module HigA family antidote
MMKNPPHPGQSFDVACLEPNDLSVTEGAKVLGVTRQTVSKLVNGKTGISPEMAIRISKAFGGTAHGWYAMQTAYDLAQANKKADKIKVKPYKAPKVEKPDQAHLNF